MERIRSIIVPTDLSPLSDAAVARAVTLARLDGASIHLVHAVRFLVVAAPYGVSVPVALGEAVRRAAQKELEEVRNAIEKKGISGVTSEVAEANDAVEAIRAAVESHSADLVVMGTHGREGLKHAFLGSVAERTLRTLDRSVLAVKEDVARAEQPIERMLLAVDFSVHSERATEVAAALAMRLGASVDVVHAFDLPADFMPYTSDLGVELQEKIQAGAAERLEGVRERLKESQVRVTVHLRRGHPSLVIADAATELRSQLIVMGTRGASGLAHVLLGSVAERTLRSAPCSVLAVRA
jgi:nucleotide-binding universal stress UspA family protein